MLHSQTTLVLAALLFLTLPVMVWLALKPAADRAVAFWCAGGLMAGSAIVLMGLRPWLPMVLSFHVANTCVLGSLVLWSHSLRATLGRPWPDHVLVLWLLLCAAFYSVLFATVSPWMRGLAVRLALGGLAWHTAYWAWRLSQRMRSGNAVAIALNYALLGLILIVQGLLTASSTQAPNPFSNTWDASLVALTALLTAMISHFCYVGMMLDRASNERIDAQLAQQGARQTRLLESELRRMDRRRRMTILSGSLAHELNQPLTACLVNAQLAERQWAAEPRATPAFLSLLQQMEAGIDRTVQILQRIRAGSETDWPELQAIDLRQVLEQSLTLVDPDIRRQSVVLKLACSSAPLPCMGDEVALSQVLVNLLRNAIQAMSASAERTLTVTCHTEGGRVRIRVRDTGPGLSPTLSGQWGEPLLSTKPEGLGMGLAISRDIVDRHQGELSLHNLAQGGAEALLSLPLLQEAA